MYLKALELQGFKSFPEKTLLTFGEEITAIVGPNGSGKSNLSDAIRWVMGEQSSKMLRGGKMEDVIFGGTLQRRQTGYAEVSLLLDNEDGGLGVEEREVMVTRRYYRSGESEYYLNRRSVRLKEIHQLFLDTGLGREGYSVIGQGKIDEILSLRSTDRREIFEAAAGIARYRYRKEEAERRLEHTEENLLRIQDKMEELSLQIEPLREQSRQAKDFLILRDQLRELEISLWLHHLEELRQKLGEVQKVYQGAFAQKETAERAVEQHFSAVDQLSQRMGEKELEMDQLRFAVQRQEVSIREQESAVAVLKEKLQNQTESMERLQEELQQRDDRREGLKAQQIERRQQLSQLEEDVLQLHQQVEQQRERMETLLQKTRGMGEELDRLREEGQAKRRQVHQMRESISALSGGLQGLQDRTQGLHQGSADLEQALDQARERCQSCQSGLAQAEAERVRQEGQLALSTQQMDQAQEKLEHIQGELGQLRIRETTLGSRIRLLSDLEKAHEGYSKGVKLTMEEVKRGGLQGVHGPVAQLLQVPKEYTLALETALGSAMQYLVVDREEDGREIIHYLKQRRGGRVTMLPLCAIKPSRLQQPVWRERGFVGMAHELIHFDQKYEAIFSNLLGRVVVMENLDLALITARAYGYAFRIVTLDGQVLHPGGSMTGGSSQPRGGILSRANELKQMRVEQQRVQREREELGQREQQCHQDYEALRCHLEETQRELRRWEDAILKAQGESAWYQNQVEELERQQKQGQKELEQLARQAQMLQEELTQSQKKLQTLEQEEIALVQREQAHYQGQQGLQEHLLELTQELAQLNARLAGREAEREGGKQALLELEGLGMELEEEQNQRRGLLQEYLRQNQSIQQDIAAGERRVVQLTGEIEEGQKQIAQLNQEKLELEGRRVRETREGQEKNKELLLMTQEVSRLEQSKLALGLEEKQLLDKLWDTYELSHEGALSQRRELESIPKASREIGILRKKLAQLGSVNLGAIQEFQRVNERYQYLTDQRNDVSTAKEELLSIIQKVTGEMKERFAKEFAQINLSFQETFLQLFGGGRASLELENPEDMLNCGIEICVQPPGKSVKQISLLSGGEKAFVAIALYFSILKVRPTPFVVMDEIEAALDDHNVVRFAQYMRSVSGQTQFIVITHRRKTMEAADVLYGVTMQEQGVSRMVHLQLQELEERGDILG